MLSSTPMLGASEGVSSIWNDDISITWTRVAAGGSSSRMAVPMLPPICTSRPAEPQDMGDQRRGRRLAVGAGDGDEGRVGAARRPLAAEQLDVADDLHARRPRLDHRPMRLRDG